MSEIVSRSNWSRSSSSARGYGWRWQLLRLRVLRRDRFLCLVCLEKGRITSAEAVDHIKPKAQGGEDAMSNLRSICDDCHKVVGLEQQGKRVVHRTAFNADGLPVNPAHHWNRGSK